MTDHVKLRTDVVLSCIMGQRPPLTEYLLSLNGNEVTKQDMAALAMANPDAPYAMKDLESPMPPSEMVIPDHKDYLAGHTKISTSYATDWPIAGADNRFGEHHPFGMKSNCCPLLHGSAWGEPHYVQHLFDFITHWGEAHAEQERTNKHDHETAKTFGQPQESIMDLRNRSLQNSKLSEEEWEAEKREHFTNNFGLLPYLFGLEWNDEEQIDKFIEILGNLSQTEDMSSPDAKKLLNDVQGKCGITWDRALRNWRDRFTPLAAWWQRPSDRSGPTASGGDMFHSAYVGDKEGHNYHWWEPFQHWGGVGRDLQSFNSMLSQTYPRIFNEGWISPFLTDAVPIEGPHMLSGSHFPVASNTAPEHAHAHTPLSMGEGMDFERRRSNWPHASNHHHLHPSEIEGQGNRTTIPTSAFNFSKLGQSIMQTADVGKPRAGLSREEHPNSNDDYYNLHNRHYKNSDDAMASVMMDMAMEVGQQFGPHHLKAAAGDRNAANLARGNTQQLAAAANYALMRGQGVHGHSYSIPDYSSGMLGRKRGTFGPVHPGSESVAPPIFNSGNTDAWGHEMPATLGWNWDREANKVRFDVKDTPFNVMQRTAHEGLVSAVDPSWRQKPILGKLNGINALTPNQFGYPSLTADLHKSDDDYEPTGVFNSTIEPAHVVRDLDDMETLKGFSGEWIVQKKPKGEHVLVKKTGKSVDPMSLPSKVKKSLKDTVEGDVIFDGYVKGDVLTVVDLLLHKGDDLHMEPLSDRVNILKTLYSSTDNVHYPAPSSCVTTDEEGLTKTIANLDRTDLLLRDATSAFIKGREVHPKWVLYAQDKISKSLPLPPLPEISIKGKEIILEYPTIHYPVIVKTDADENGIFVNDYEGLSYLVKQAQAQFNIWSPVAALHIDVENESLRHIPSFNIRPVLRKSIDKAPEVITESEFDDETSISDIMRHARKAITSDDKALTSKDLIAHVDGLTESILDNYAGEYGLEQTEDGKKWTVNEAIDDDIAEKFAFPRMNRASGDGGAWSGMQADITAPTGPTEITDDENTTFGDPRENQEEVDVNAIFRPLHMVVQTEDGDAVLDISERKATIKFPRKEKDHDEVENEVLPATRDDKAL